MDDMDDNANFGHYVDPVRQLLFVGDTGDQKVADWPDYRGRFGIDHRHVDALIRMACDSALNHADPDSLAVWAPVHAWRALAQSRAEESVEPLLALLTTLERDDELDLELPIVFGMIGAPALPRIAAFVLDRANPEWPVITAVSAIREIAERHPDCREDCVGTSSTVAGGASAFQELPYSRTARRRGCSRQGAARLTLSTFGYSKARLTGKGPFDLLAISGEREASAISTPCSFVFADSLSSSNGAFSQTP